MRFLVIRISDFGFVSDFEIRILDFGILSIPWKFPRKMPPRIWQSHFLIQFLDIRSEATKKKPSCFSGLCGFVPPRMEAAFLFFHRPRRQ
jgi:hypothetical protein